MYLTDGKRLSEDSYFKTGYSDDPYELLKKFADDLNKIHSHCVFKFNSHPKVPKLTPDEQEKHDNAIACEECHKEFLKEHPKMRHHDHVTGKYIGAWCHECNFREGMIKFPLVVFFYYLRGYDGHILIRYGLSEIIKTYQDIGLFPHFVIGRSSEKLSSFRFGPFIFRDSYLHLGCSLETVVNNLIKSNYHFPICEKFGLPKTLREKGVYPYS
jgi:hypothetical protein